uniref:NADH-ubiquinone oxidoreductase chain 6 n=1 Tax=Scolopocryptops sp. 1 YG-2013 TaxID=1285684 RepID=R4IVG9_9MYRI|nr:NAHD dehydrogenase subunit 6 [Scolopocryptops sp. 1 YG-2013]
MLTILIMLSIFVITMFLVTSNPLSFVIIIIIQTLCTALYTLILQNSPWMSYILFLIFLGGMLILFSYISSLASNETFNLLNLKLMSQTFLTFLMLYLLTPNPKMLKVDTNKMINLTELYNQNMSITLLLILYLMLALVIVTNLANIKMGPLRTLT